jgi:MoxR-like ATPase
MSSTSTHVYSTQHLNQMLDDANKVIVGKNRQIKLALCCLLSKGHLLIEDIPGVGKTTLAHLLAAITGMQFSRIQFTSDLLPADVTGISIFEKDSNQFRFHPGPIFSQLVLADELNRAPAKTQSALLEVMEEHQISVDGETHDLPEPFFVIATQNPREQMGTYGLPESQLDRFMMRINMGYPDRETEREILKGEDRREMIDRISAVISPEQLVEWQQQVSQTHVSDSLLDYVQDIIDFSRESGHFVNGLSPRAGLALVYAAKAWAYIEQRDIVLPDDVKQILPAVVTHRLQLREETSMNEQEVINLFSKLNVI